MLCQCVQRGRGEGERLREELSLSPLSLSSLLHLSSFLALLSLHSLSLSLSLSLSNTHTHTHTGTKMNAGGLAAEVRGEGGGKEGAPGGCTSVAATHACHKDSSTPPSSSAGCGVVAGAGIDVHDAVVRKEQGTHVLKASEEGTKSPRGCFISRKVQMDSKPGSSSSCARLFPSTLLYSPPLPHSLSLSLSRSLARSLALALSLSLSPAPSLPRSLSLPVTPVSLTNSYPLMCVMTLLSKSRKSLL